MSSFTEGNEFKNQIYYWGQFYLKNQQMDGDIKCNKSNQTVHAQRKLEGLLISLDF